MGLKKDNEYEGLDEVLFFLDEEEDDDIREQAIREFIEEVDKENEEFYKTYNLDLIELYEEVVLDINFIKFDKYYQVSKKEENFQIKEGVMNMNMCFIGLYPNKKINKLIPVFYISKKQLYDTPIIHEIKLFLDKKL